MEKSNKVRKTVWLSEKILETCERGMEIDNCRFLNEYIENALKYYYANLIIEENDEVVAEIFTKILNAKLSQTEERLAQLIFKVAVEEAKQSNIMSKMIEVDVETLNKLHKKCCEEIKRTNGNYTFEEIYRFQNQ